MTIPHIRKRRQYHHTRTHRILTSKGGCPYTEGGVSISTPTHYLFLDRGPLQTYSTNTVQSDLRTSKGGIRCHHYAHLLPYYRFHALRLLSTLTSQMRTPYIRRSSSTHHGDS